VVVRAALTASLLSFALALSACGRGEPADTTDDGAESHPYTGPLEPQDPVDRVEARGTGRTMNGTYSLRVPVGNVSAATLVFTSDGAYSRALTVGGSPRSDSGTYLIDGDGRLVLFVERRGDAQFTTAVRETYGMSGDAAGTILVTPPGGDTEELVRTGDPPAQGAPRAE
jgi:hypothetical protein